MRILVYTGKGGVGKTSVAAATAGRLAALGRRTLVLSTASGIGERLARRGLVHRHRKPEDRRVVVVRLTRKGETAAGKFRAQIEGLLRRAAGALTEEEQAQLLTLVAKVWAAFQVPPQETSPGTAFRSIPIEE